jgi:hypothetical protein
LIIGCTADLHYGIDPSVSRHIEAFIERAIAPAGLDVLILAGDLAESAGLSYTDVGRHHQRLLTMVRNAAGCPVAFCAGNHDIWSTDPWLDSLTIYQQVLPEAAARTGTTYLDAGNLAVGSVLIAGCYGHYDYSLRTPDLSFNGQKVGDEHYRAQRPPGTTDVVWMDALNIHWEWDDPQACAWICDAGRRRVGAGLATRPDLVLVSHTVPRAEANGHTRSGRPVSQFLNAFSGTLRLEEILRNATARAGRVLSISGHTHKRVPLIAIDGVEYLNVGGNYGAPRLEILHWPEPPRACTVDADAPPAPRWPGGPSGSNAPPGSGAPPAPPEVGSR